MIVVVYLRHTHTNPTSVTKKKYLGGYNYQFECDIWDYPFTWDILSQGFQIGYLISLLLESQSWQSFYPKSNYVNEPLSIHFHYIGCYTLDLHWLCVLIYRLQKPEIKLFKEKDAKQNLNCIYLRLYAVLNHTKTKLSSMQLWKMLFWKNIHQLQKVKYDSIIIKSLTSKDKDKKKS